MKKMLMVIGLVLGCAARVRAAEVMIEVSDRNLIRAHSETVLQTNVVESPYDPARHNGLVFYASIPPLREKWVTTTVVEQTSLTFDWNGSARSVVSERGVSTNTVHLRIKDNWEEVK